MKTKPPAKETSFQSPLDIAKERIENLPSQKAVPTVIILLLVAAGLSVLASIPFIQASWYMYVQTVVAFPAGLMLFLALLTLKNKTRVGEWSVFNTKANKSHAKRIRITALTALVIVIIFISAGTFIPYGVGGTLIVAIIAVLYDFIRRTPEEIHYAKFGIIDPRDINEDGEIDAAAVVDLSNPANNNTVNVIQGTDDEGNLVVEERTLLDTPDTETSADR